MITTLIILALSAVFFVNGKLRSDLVALCALVLLIVFNILTPEEALSGFSNPIVMDKSMKCLSYPEKLHL